MGDRRAERSKTYLLVRLSYTPISAGFLGVDLVSFVSPLVRLSLSSCFPFPRPTFLCPCLDCAHHTPSTSYFTSTGCFCRVVPPSTPSVCILFTNVIPLICVFIVVPRIPRRIQPGHCAPSSSTFFWLFAVPPIASLVVQYFRFPLICLYSPTLCLFLNLYNCNHAMVYQPIGLSASRCAACE